MIGIGGSFASAFALDQQAMLAQKIIKFISSVFYPMFFQNIG
jgi:hypothetical protein